MADDYTTPRELPDDEVRQIAREAEAAVVYHRTLTRAFIAAADALAMTVAWIQSRHLPKIELPPERDDDRPW